MKISLTVAMSLLSITSTSAFCADFTVDPAHSHVGFSIKHLVSRVQGEFKDFAGKFTYDAKKPADSKGEFTIKTASINTNTEKRDNHLRSPDFFDAEKNPTITFKSTSVKPGSKGKLKLIGDLTMHGVTKPATFDVEINGIAKDPMGSERLGASAIGHINRKDFGLNWNKALETGGFLVGDDVEMRLDIEAIKDAK